MKKSNIFIILLLIFTLCMNLTAQENDSTEKKSKKRWRFDYHFIEDGFFYKGSPSIEAAYGQSDASLENYSSNVLDAGIFELKIGWHKEKDVRNQNVVIYKNNFLHGAFISSNIRASNSTSGAQSTLRFGFGSSRGYGYKLGNKASLLLYNSNSFTWTRYDYGAKIYTFELEGHTFRKLDDFDKTLRFGSTAEGGIIIPVGSIVNLQASYDRTIVFPRHLILKHLGSIIIETAGQSLIDGFVNAVLKSTPAAAPIVSFVLKSGLSYGLYELRKEKMNWPFNSAEPLLFDSYKAGLTFTF
ncbi:MAG: hypothetical protein L0Y79_09995 [Chlorobi bacterium]|nr:hypothetical protein [Chlorobiota bacterium]MCI0715200.1 hypothetical protein [Chlorobiota bacterium]